MQRMAAVGQLLRAPRVNFAAVSAVVQPPVLLARPFVMPSRGFAVPASTPTMSGTAKSKLEKQKRLARKKTAAQLIKVRQGPVFHLEEAIRILKAMAGGPYDQTVDLQVQLGIDPRKSNQAVRGVAQLPHGTGKKIVIAVFAKGEKAEEARKAGASLVGAEDLVERVSKGEIAFNKTIATPDMMPLVGRIARILGPRGLMPNPKLGTVTPNVREAVQAAKKGQAEFRAEKRGIVSVAVGKTSFGPGELRENIRALLMSLSEQKPDGFKGTYMRQAFLSSTHGPGMPLDLAMLDPTSARFMAAWDAKPAAVTLAVPVPAAAATAAQ